MSAITALIIFNIVGRTANGTMDRTIIGIWQNDNNISAIKMKYYISLVICVNILLQSCFSAICLFIYELTIRSFNAQINGILQIQMLTSRFYGGIIIRCRNNIDFLYRTVIS